ncbi:MAG: hypothetical protein GY838_13155 [bacterium]|nr:hypothetical protein [bacterium]
MSKDRLFEEMVSAVTTVAVTPAGMDAGWVPWAAIHKTLVDYAARADARETQRETDGREQDEAHVSESLRANKADGRCRRMRMRIQELERRPTVSAAAATIQERDTYKRHYESRVEESRRSAMEAARLSARLERVRADLAALITIYEQEPEHVALLIQSIRERSSQTLVVPAAAVGPTEEALARAQQAYAAIENSSIVEYNFAQAILEVVQSLAKRQDATEGDTFNILKALKKMEGG